MIARGASSAKRSRTMNASSSREADIRAVAAQSIARMSSPGRYGRDPALDVAWNDEPAVVQQRPAACGPLERERAANGCADRDELMLARHAHKVDDPLLDQLVHIHLLRGTLQRLHLLDRQHGLEQTQRMAGPLLREDPPLLDRARIAERGTEEKPVELRLG